MVVKPENDKKKVLETCYLVNLMDHLFMIYDIRLMLWQF